LTRRRLKKFQFGFGCREEEIEDERQEESVEYKERRKLYKGDATTEGFSLFQKGNYREPAVIYISANSF